MNEYLSFLLIVILFVACSDSSTEQTAQRHGFTAIQSIEIVEVDYSTSPDCFHLFFKIKDSNGSPVKTLTIEKDSIRLYENGKEVLSLVVKVLYNGVFSKNTTVSLLIDRSKDIPSNDMNRIMKAVKEIVINLPDSCVYISFFGNNISKTRLITKDNFSEFYDEFLPTDNNKSLYNAIYAKLKEFEGDKNVSLNLEKGYQLNQTLVQRAVKTQNYLIILTDGNDKPIAGNNIDLMELNEYADNINTELRIFAIRYGNDYKISKYYQIDDILKAICVSRNLSNPALQGDFFKADSSDILSKFKDVTDNMSADYVIDFSNYGKTYNGLTEYRMEIKGNRNSAGYKKVAIGSPENPRTVQPIGKKPNFFITILFGFLVGLIFSVILFIIMQLLIPLLKNKLFDLKYVKKYKPESSRELKKICAYCGINIQNNDWIVARCNHIVHKACWGENNHQCPEYGQNCKSGKQNFFNIEEPFSKYNKQSYLIWVLNGLLGGWVAWFFYALFFYFSDGIFGSFSKWLTEIFYIGFSLQAEAQQRQILSALQDKIPGLLGIGFILGFLLSFLFSLTDDYRKKDWKVYFNGVIRACCGAMFGFIAFLLGSIILLLLSPSPHTGFWWLYSIPSYLLFGISIGYCLSIKSTVSLKDGIIGGTVSIFIGFVILYFTTTLLKEYGTMLTFMIYGAGLGFSIATVRSYSEHYFLLVRGDETKEKKIAIHKWMNASGGSHEIYIGKANDCEIQMNWDKNNNVGKKHVKLYYDKYKNASMLHVLETNVFLNGRVKCEKNMIYRLVNDDEFRIGNTQFRYFEED